VLPYFDLLAPIYDRIFPPKMPKRLLPFFNADDLHRVIEIGGGTGRLTQFFVPLAEQVWLLDPSAAMLEQAARHPDLKLVQGYAQEMTFDDHFFDLVLIYDSLHHWRDQKQALEEIRRTLAPGKPLVIVEIHPYVRSGYYIWLMEHILRMGSNFFSPSELKSLFTGAGYHVQEQGWLRKPAYYTVATNPG